MKTTKVTKSYFETEGERVYFFEPLLCLYKHLIDEDMSVKEIQEMLDEHETLHND